MPRQDVDDVLAHYGIPGMRWGKRKGSSASTNTPSPRKVPDAEDHVKARQIQAKKVSQMSTEELRTLTSRMQLEKQYRDLQLQQKPIKKGKSAIDKILESSEKANKIVKAYNSPVGKFVRKTVKNTAYAAAGFDPPKNRSSADTIRWAIEDGTYAY